MVKVFWHDFDFCFQDFQNQLFEMLAENDTIELDLDRLRFDFQEFADGIVGCTIFDRHVIPPCRVEAVNADTFEVAITSDHPKDIGKVVWMSFPYDFISRLRFEEPIVQNYAQYLIKLMKQTWTIGATCKNPESAYALAMCEMLDSDNSDIIQALEYCCQAADAGYGYAQVSLLCICLVALDRNLDVDAEIIKKAVEYTEEWYKTGDYLASYYLGFYYLHKKDYAEVMKYFNEVMECDNAAPAEKNSIAEIIAPFYKDGLRDKNGNTIVYRNIYTAKKYYEMANHNGEHDADLECINRMLGIHSNQNQMQLFAEKVLSLEPRLSGRDLYSYVVDDLSSEFGDCWYQLPESSRQDLVSGCQVYIMLYSLGADLCKNIDFSSAIIPIVKASEIVFRRYLSAKYYDYLIDKGVQAHDLPNKHPFVEFDKFTRKTVYKHKDRVEFTLGSIKYIVDLQNGPTGLRTVSKYFLDYACFLFGIDENNRLLRNQLENYFVRLANQMNQFAFNIRNPAAHSDIMPVWQAEICGNEIIKVRKVLKDFMERIDNKHL